MNVLVFKTNVCDAGIADMICNDILANNNVHRVNFDLHDDEKILRVEAEDLVTEIIIGMVLNRGYACVELE